MKKILIIGAGTHGRVVAEVANACGYSVSFLDDKPGKDIVGPVNNLPCFLKQFDAFFVGIGNNDVRRRIQEQLEQLGVLIPTLVHPTAYVSPSAQIEVGTIVEPGAIVNTNSRVAKGCIISVGAIVDHDVTVEPFAHVNAGAICKGGAVVKAGQKLEAGEVLHGFN